MEWYTGILTNAQNQVSIEFLYVEAFGLKVVSGQGGNTGNRLIHYGDKQKAYGKVNVELLYYSKNFMRRLKMW